MCTSCGCEHNSVTIDGHSSHPAHDHQSSISHNAERDQNIDPPTTEAGRVLEIERDLLSRNDAYAAANRALLGEHSIFSLNFVSSPGAGKTTLLVRTIEALREHHGMAVIEGDQQTANDAERIRATGVPAVQINTGKGCHLDAHMLSHGFGRLAVADGSMLFIENVGNLVCPAAFDLGEAMRVAVVSVTEGDDKPLKYPDIFASADLVLINKIDLLPYVDSDPAALIANARRINPGVAALTLSATTGEGFDRWLRWLQAGQGLYCLGRMPLQEY